MPAQLFPSDLSIDQFEGAAARQWDVLCTLREGLPDGFCVFHGLHWTRLQAGLTISGQFQFLILGPKGSVVCMLMRTGLLVSEEGQLLKRVGNRSEDLIALLNEQLDRLKRNVVSQLQFEPHLEPLLYCPDHTVQTKLGLGLPPERLLDSKDRRHLVNLCLEIDESVPERLGGVQSSHVKDRLLQFFLNSFQLVPDVSVMSQAVKHWTLRLQQGLDDWVQGLEFSPFKLRVNGVAGCGKTLLAVSQIRLAHARQQPVLYVCYNRPLAAHLASHWADSGVKESSSKVMVVNFHALCDQLLRQQGIVFSFSQPDAFEQLVALALEQPIDNRFVFDQIIVDEGQDFEPHWFDLLTKLAHPETGWLVMQDPAQNLYDKPELHLDVGWVTLNARKNYRSPVRFIELLNELKGRFSLPAPDQFQMECGSPVQGLEPEWFKAGSPEALIQETARAITRCLKLGFERSQIVVLSMRGLKNSVVLNETQLGPHTVSHFTGRYNSNGEPLFTEGVVMAESIYRFKGQSAQAVVLTEVDCEPFDQAQFRKLWVGLTRARLFVALVGSLGP